MRLIDADRLSEAIYDNVPAPYEDASWAKENCLAEIEAAQTIDAVEVVLCRDCKYWGDEDGKSQGEDGVLFARCNVHNYLIDGRHTGWCPAENDFCSCGERKEGAD